MSEDEHEQGKAIMGIVFIVGLLIGILIMKILS